MTSGIELLPPRQTGPRGGRVLLVDDDLISQDLVLFMLERLGCKTDVANDGAGAVSAVRAKRYAVVLMDIQMPHMDGMEAASLIRGDSGMADQPAIIAMTADTTLECQHSCRQAGMNGHLRKPVYITELAKVMKHSFERRGAVRSDYGQPGGFPVAERFPAVLDAPALESAVSELGADKAFRAELIQTSIVEIQERLTAIEAARRAIDLEALSFQAHAIKSSSATVGLMALSQVAKSIEEAAEAMAAEVDVGFQASLLITECHKAIGALNTLALK